MCGSMQGENCSLALIGSGDCALLNCSAFLGSVKCSTLLCMQLEPVHGSARTKEFSMFRFKTQCAKTPFTQPTGEKRWSGRRPGRVRQGVVRGLPGAVQFVADLAFPGWLTFLNLSHLTKQPRSL